MSVENAKLTNLTNSGGCVAKLFNIYEAKTNLSELVELAVQGEEIIIAKAGVPMVRLVAMPGPKVLREPGGSEGKIWIAPDFDEPLPDDLLRLFEGEGDKDLDPPT